MKCAFYTLGCKVNQYETGAMAQELERHGFTCVSPGEEADVYVINSCTVTAESDRKTRQAVRRFRANHPDSIIVLTGCMVQASPGAADNLPEADIVLGNKTNNSLYGMIMQFIGNHSRTVAIEPHKIGDKFNTLPVTDYRDKTRAVIKIEDGCNRFCSYCIIPYARGRVRSKPVADIVSETKALAANGFSEIVAVGINLSAYGSDIGENLVNAVSAIASVEGIERVRLGSLEPDHITPEVISGLAQIKEFCPQFHISLQSGCDRILKRMNRHYSSVEYEDLCGRLREVFPDVNLTTDVMVGFPGETDSDFRISLDFVKRMKFEKVHVFPYSRRPGTPAANMPEQVENAEKQRRAEIVMTECEKIRLDYLRSQIGKTLEIIPEENHGGEIKGYTANYTPVTVVGKCEFGKLTKVLITGVGSDSCLGTAVE
ncbi:MAG: tRNA (N(6)-L-threonylcarbamoyladenosine(37)-C(2))-methylthiotransferase MtaB [Clostridia bacterium]|nr:tRNA (N(6)-L-threonylcarbamoyladenosine(37)-C(2))-methylthiotransferase MtaB [Clostridia bacterium]